MDAAVVRLRVQFEDHRQILKKLQRSEGLKRSWVLLKPYHRTIFDLSEYIFEVFELHHSCPNGNVLSMDGFVLPPFESTSILRDKDVVGVKKKEKLLLELTGVDNGQKLLEEGEIVEKKALLTNTPLLANEEFEKGSGGYQSEPVEQGEDDKGNQSEDDLYEEKSLDGNEVSKKRKASKKLGSSKKRKKRQTAEDYFLVDENKTNGFHPGESSTSDKKVSEVKKKFKKATTLASVESNNDTSQPLPSPKRQKRKKRQTAEDDFLVDENKTNGFHPGESSNSEKKVSEVKKKFKKATTFASVESNDDTSQPLPSPKSSSPIQDNGTECGAATQAPNGTEKKPSRSARRKKMKRQWLREIVKAERGLFLLSDNTCSQPGTCGVKLKKTQSPEIDVNKHSVEHQQQNESCEADNEIAPDTEAVPIVIRPGHIRFEPLEEDGEALQQRHAPAEITQWNGITSKKKGQKWGKEKPTYWRNESQGSKKEHTEAMAIDEVKLPSDRIDFDNLSPLSRLPREGDLISYRLVELSSTWTPELTSFRVGKTSWYDSQSNKILLAPLPEYPIVIEKKDGEEDTFAQPPNNSFYMEDGSLEIEFSSLVDVRMVKESDSDPTNVISDQANGATSSTAIPNGNGTHDSTPHSEKQEKAWDEISEALSGKKAELMRENSWMKENSGKEGWSYRAMRGSAIGPIMALLRANEI